MSNLVLAVTLLDQPQRRDYEISEDGRTVALTTKGLKNVEAKLNGVNLYDDEHVADLSAINVALHAHALLERDVDYIVRDNTVELVEDRKSVV